MDSVNDSLPDITVDAVQLLSQIQESINEDVAVEQVAVEQVAVEQVAVEEAAMKEAVVEEVENAFEEIDASQLQQNEQEEAEDNASDIRDGLGGYLGSLGNNGIRGSGGGPRPGGAVDKQAELRQWCTDQDIDDIFPIFAKNKFKKVRHVCRLNRADMFSIGMQLGEIYQCEEIFAAWNRNNNNNNFGDNFINNNNNNTGDSNNHIGNSNNNNFNNNNSNNNNSNNHIGNMINANTNNNNNNNNNNVGNNQLQMVTGPVNNIPAPPSVRPLAPVGPRSKIIQQQTTNYARKRTAYIGPPPSASLIQKTREMVYNIVLVDTVTTDTKKIRRVVDNRTKWGPQAMLRYYYDPEKDDYPYTPIKLASKCCGYLQDYGLVTINGEDFKDRGRGGQPEWIGVLNRHKLSEI